MAIARSAAELALSLRNGWKHAIDAATRMRGPNDSGPFVVLTIEASEIGVAVGNAYTWSQPVRYVDMADIVAGDGRPLIESIDAALVAWSDARKRREAS